MQVGDRVVTNDRNRSSPRYGEAIEVANRTLVRVLLDGDSRSYLWIKDALKVVKKEPALKCECNLCSK